MLSNVDVAGSSAEQVGLKWHNYYRNIHKARQMNPNSGMNGGAMGFAKELARLGNFPGHRPPEGQGENVGVQCRSGSDADLVKAVVESW